MEAPALTRTRAKALRKRMTLPEVLLWQSLRGRDRWPIFRRQEPFGPYILDFYCLAARLVIEVDGRQHDDNEAVEHDLRRTAYLNQHGLEVMRIAAAEVLRDVGTIEVWVRQRAAQRVNEVARL